MAILSIMASRDAETGLYYVELFMPAEAAKPIARTTPRFQTEDDAIDEARHSLTAALNLKEVKPH